MANYLLECEIVGGTISSAPAENTITAKPIVVYPKSELEMTDKDYAVLFSADKGSFKPANIETATLFPLNGGEKTLTLKIGAGLGNCEFLRKTFNRVVLELEAKKQDGGETDKTPNFTVVGFKAQF